MKRLWLAGFAAVTALCSPAALYAQACPLCYQTSVSADFIRALKAGIFALLFPSMLIFAVISVLTYRRRDDCGEAETPQPPSGGSN